MDELVLLINKTPYRIGDKVKDARGNVGVITRMNVESENEDSPFKVDFLGIGEIPCAWYGPNAFDPTLRVTLVDPVSYPEKPEALRRSGPEWGELGDLEDFPLDAEHGIHIEGEEEPEAYTLDS